MTFEQPASLNRFVAKPVPPLTWSSRWKSIRIFLPLLVFITICMLERIGFESWKRDRFEFSLLWLAFLPSGFLLVVVLVSTEIRLRGAQKIADRFLNVLEDGISFDANGRPLIRWQKVIAFWFETISAEPQFSKVTLEYFGDRKTKFPRRASFAFDNQRQCPALLSELKLLQQQHRLNFRVEQTLPLPLRPQPRNTVLGMSLFLAGFFFLMHGAPLVLASLSHPDGKTHQSDSADEWSPNQQKNVAKFLHSHFPTRAEFNHFMLEVGSILSAVGVGLMVFGNVVQKQKKDKEPPDSLPKM